MKRLFSLLLIFVVALILSSCGGQVDWTDPNGYVGAKCLASSYVEDDKNLVITIENKDDYLNNITKDKIIVKPRNNDSDDKEKELTPEELKKDTIKDYELEVKDNKVKISLNNYEKNIYLVVFNKSITKDNNFAYAYASLMKDTYFDQPYVKAVESDYVFAQENPTFSVEYYNIDIKDKTKIEFAGVFEDLSVIQVSELDDMFTIVTDGIILYGELGIVTLKAGFFEGINEDVTLYFDVDLIAYFLDSTSIKVENNILSFDVMFSNRSFINLTTDNIILGELEASAVEISGMKRNVLTIYVPFEGTIDQAIRALSTARLFVDEKLDDNDVGDEIPISIYFPSYNLFSEFEDNLLTLHFRYHDVLVFGDIVEDLITIESEDIKLTGDNKNATIKEFNETINGFDLLIETTGSLDSVSGTLRFSNDHETFKTLWGEVDIAPTINFEVKRTTSAKLTADTYDESFSEKMITAKPGINELAKVLQFAGYAAQLGVAIYTGQAGQGIGAVLSILQLFGLNGKSGEPTIQDVLNKLEDMSNQLKSIDRKIDALKQQMLDSTTAIQLGVDKILFNQYRSTWDEFYENYIEKIENLLSNYTTDIRTYYVDFVRDDSDLTLNLEYYQNGDNKVLSVENPKDKNFCIEGYPFLESKAVNIKKSYFAEVAQLSRQTQGYSADFDKTFRKNLLANIKGEYQTLTEEEQNALYEDTYGYIAGLAQFAAVNENTAKEMRNLFINFAKQIAGTATGTSKMVYYYKMLESLYNFQSEAKNEMLQFRVNMKRLLDKYAGYATIMAQFCPGIDKAEITDAYNAAYDYIKNNDNMRQVGQNEDYCYTINSKIAAKAVRCSFDKGFNNAGKNNCTFYYNYRVYNQENNQTIDVVNNTKLLTDSNLKIIHARAVNILHQAGKSGDVDLITYFMNKSIITENMFNKIGYQEAVTSYNGITDLSSTDFKVVCTSIGVGDYFGYGNIYGYRSEREKDCWSGKEASGTLFNLRTATPGKSYIDRMARYDESHWYWSTDEHWAFEEYLTGKLAYAIIKV